MIHYPEEQEYEDDEDFEEVLADSEGLDPFFAELDRELMDEEDMEDDLDRRVDTIMARRKKSVVRGSGLFGI